MQDSLDIKLFNNIGDAATGISAMNGFLLAAIAALVALLRS